MVTFVSECEKKALRNTRRVLDSFANRIGHNTWQTAITEEGLITVKRLLRESASKNTAVACHLIKSRRRSQFLWSIGCKDKFNSRGFVPVNYTEKELILDGVDMDIEQVYANTNKQKLNQHLFAVGYVASQIINKIINHENTNRLSKIAFVSGCFHDIGKLDPQFQAWLNALLDKGKVIDEGVDGVHIVEAGKFSFEKHASHNEISLLIYYLMDDISNKELNKASKTLIKHCIYWHHAKRFRKAELDSFESIYRKLGKSLGNIKFETFFNDTISLMNSVNSLGHEYGSEFSVDGLLSSLDVDKIEDLAILKLPIYKDYSIHNDCLDDYTKEIGKNTSANLVRAVVISADRLVSELDNSDLENHIKNKTLNNLLEPILFDGKGLDQNIVNCLKRFEQVFPNSERNKLQTIAAKELAEVDEEINIKVLNGPAGCGKTKISLEWALLTDASKIIWVCPRVQVCQGLFNDLTSAEYLPNAKIEINTGEFKYINTYDNPTMEDDLFSGDIVLTTIDQVINSITTHRNVTNFIEYMTSHIIFDEFHEYINMPAFNVLFAELVEAKKYRGENARTILVSATPNYYFIEKFLGIDRRDIVNVKSFNDSLYKIDFEIFDEAVNDESNPLFKRYNKSKSTFIISNTATTAQKSFIQHQQEENAILLHSKFKKSDKLELFNKVFESYKRGGDRKYDLLRSGPVVQASLNISCDKMVTEFTNAENWLQRLGRLDRFGQNEEENNYTIAIPESISNGKSNGGCARFLGKLFTFKSAKAWYDFLQDKGIDKRARSIKDIYGLYKDFYMSSLGLKAVEDDFLAVLKKGSQIIDAKIHDPVSSVRKKNKQSKKKIKKSSLRGDSRFINMAICDLSNFEHPLILDKYACSSDGDLELTESLDLIGNSGIIDYMAQKDARINDNSLIKGIPASKMKRRKVILEGASTSPDNPIYMSYTSKDLEKIGESEPHEGAAYYAMCSRQIIGKMSLKNIYINKGE